MCLSSTLLRFAETQDLPSYHYYHNTHKTAVLFNILINGASVLPRNAGMAWEPGAFQYLLNVGFLAETQFAKRFGWIRMLIFTVAIVTTRSTVGLALLGVNIAYALFRAPADYRKLFVAILFCATPFVLNEAAYQLKYKLFGSSSFEGRSVPLLYALEYGRNFVFGLGNTVFKREFSSIVQAPWDSMGQLFIRYGYGLTLLVVSMIAVGLKRHPVLALILAASFLSQTIWFFPLTTTFLFILSQERRLVRTGVGQTEHYNGRKRISVSLRSAHSHERKV